MTTPRAYLQALRLAAHAPDLPESLDRAQRRHFERLRAVLSDPNVVGIGIAEKKVGRERIGTLALTFYVREKRPRDHLRGATPVPTVVASPSGKAIFTDVIEVGEVLPQAAITRAPIQSGYSIAHKTSGPGTLGAIVTWRNAPALLSNAHVLARSGFAALGDEILYPAGSDGGRSPQDVVGQLANYKALNGGGAFVNRFDAALATIAAHRLADLDLAIPGAAAPLQWVAPRRDMRVRIAGRTSGVVHSVISDANMSIQLPYAEVGLVGFFGQCACDPYTNEGDSGSIVLEADTGAVVGLHFAASAHASYFSPIKPIMDALRFTL